LPHTDVDIAPDGSIYADGAEVAQIGLFQFENNEVLQRAGEGLFLPNDGSQPTQHINPQIIQKNIETSNVDMMREMVRMTTNLRTFEAIQKALKIYGDMGSKGAEIGLVQ
jgi:flagellar basal body rod protein FlgG